MKRALFSIMILAAVSVITGCFTSATAYTKKTSADGVVTESKCSIIGTGDKVSQIAADGLFADGTTEDLGAGVKKASASQQSTGIGETLTGMGNLMASMAKVMAASQGGPVVSAPPTTASITPIVQQSEALQALDGIESVSGTAVTSETAYSTDGFKGASGAAGEGIYGHPSCSRCRAYRTAHPDTEIVNIDTPENRTAMWAALRRLGFTGSNVALPVAITATAYTQTAK